MIYRGVIEFERQRGYGDKSACQKSTRPFGNRRWHRQTTTHPRESPSSLVIALSDQFTINRSLYTYEEWCTRSYSITQHLKTSFDNLSISSNHPDTPRAPIHESCWVRDKRSSVALENELASQCRKEAAIASLKVGYIISVHRLSNH